MNQARIDPHRLYIGANYHPHDWPRERWPIDIAMMKEAGFDTVRLGHLCWDSFEPEDGQYDFSWSDQVMTLCAQAGIGVVLDIPLRPAPVWVHRLCPGCNIGAKSGRTVPAVRRYMEDVSDPDYQRYALRFAKTLINRYKDHPALRAFGLCNEQGAGYPSYSEASGKRFQRWLENKYGTIDRLNRAWATQRWSRRLQSFDDAVFPENELERGAPEAWLDMRRFFSDGIADFLIRLSQTVEELAPGIPHSSNHYSGKEDLGFDLLRYSDQFVDYPGIGHYPGYEMNDKAHYALMIMQERLAEQAHPLWCLEFQSGYLGMCSGPKGWNYMQAMLCLLYRTQMVLGWTWRSMLNGEEAFWGGILGHDGYPTANLADFRKTASSFRKLETAGFPYLPQNVPVGIAFSQESQWETQYHTEQFRQRYTDAVMQAHRALYQLNLDYNMVNLRDMKKNYRVLILPDHVIMSPDMADTVRQYVKSGGTVIMTGYSAVTDETGRVFDSPMPGLLSDVFGLRVAGFLRAGWPDMDGETVPSEKTVRMGDSIIRTQLAYTEQLELHGAEMMAAFEDGSCAVSLHAYGQGKAFYIAAEASQALIQPLIMKLLPDDLLLLPEGVCGRRIAPGKLFCVNTTNQAKTVPLAGNAHGWISEKDYTGGMVLPPFEAELLVESNE